MLEEASWVGPILGVDADPPRRRLRRTDFRRIALNRTAAVSQIILDFDPHVMPALLPVLFALVLPSQTATDHWDASRDHSLYGTDLYLRTQRLKL